MSAHGLTPPELMYLRSASVRAVRGVQVNEFSHAVAALERISARLGVPIAIVGGLAAIHHGVPVTTQDIDIVVPAAALDDLLEVAPGEGLIVKKRSPAGWHCLAYEGTPSTVEIHTIPEGRRSPRDPDYAPAVPSPQQLGVTAGVAYASFPQWVALKLVANRDKDRYHLIEALKRAAPDQIAQTVQCVRAMRSVYLQELERLIRAAEDENTENW